MLLTDVLAKPGETGSHGLITQTGIGFFKDAFIQSGSHVGLNNQNWDLLTSAAARYLNSSLPHRS